MESEPLHLPLVHWHVPGWLGFSCTAPRIFPLLRQPSARCLPLEDCGLEVFVFNPLADDPEQDFWVAGQRDGRPQLSRTTGCKENGDFNAVSFWQWRVRTNAGEMALPTPTTLCYVWLPAKSQTSISPCGLGSSLPLEEHGGNVGKVSWTAYTAARSPQNILCSLGH